MIQMTFSSCLTKNDRAIVLDASVIINLLATKRPDEILTALGTRVVATEHVVREIAKGAGNGRGEAEVLRQLIDGRMVDVVDLEDKSLENFFALVSGETSGSLGDGEAATLVFSNENDYVAAIDEKKATRIARERFTSLKVATTIDILSCESVQKAMPADALSQGIFLALQIAKMQVWDHQFEWVTNKIGVDNARVCPTLRRHFRNRNC